MNVFMVNSMGMELRKEVSGGGGCKLFSRPGYAERKQCAKIGGRVSLLFFPVGSFLIALKMNV